MEIVKRKLGPDFWIFYFSKGNNSVDSSFYLRYKNVVSCPSTTILFCHRLFWNCKNFPERYAQELIKMFFTEDQLLNMNNTIFNREAYLKWLEEDGNDDYKETRF